MLALAVCRASHIGAIRITSIAARLSPSLPFLTRATVFARDVLTLPSAACIPPLARGPADLVICCSFTLFLLRRGAFPSVPVRADLFSDHPSRRSAGSTPQAGSLSAFSPGLCRFAHPKRRAPKATFGRTVTLRSDAPAGFKVSNRHRADG